ncbi:MAG: PIN domain-containing protein, partial [Nitrospiraceae bacterium]|nr:PIN domain-containing protein [Nitrospiraceae bacterium]
KTGTEPSDMKKLTRSMITQMLFLVVTAVAGIYVFTVIREDPWPVGLGIGMAVGGSAILVQYLFGKFPLRIVLGGLVGLYGGLIAGGLLTYSTGTLFHMSLEQTAPMDVFIGLIMGYFGLITGIRAGREFQHAGSILSFWLEGYRAIPPKILDTSVIIDGRIADICATDFLEGIFYLPQFVIQELQYIADSADGLKRARGRRGLDILHRMRSMSQIKIQITDEDFPHIKDVDAKLVALARRMKARIITNDLNLNKVAELQGVRVLNINDLANAVKPVVLPGEVMKIYLVKEGKEFGQAIAYLDDGTMIVVDNARKSIGKNVEVSVTSVLQTSAGRMIFGKLRDDNESRQE